MLNFAKTLAVYSLTEQWGNSDQRLATREKLATALTNIGLQTLADRFFFLYLSTSQLKYK